MLEDEFQNRDVPLAEWQTEFFERHPNPQGWNYLSEGSKRAYHFADEAAKAVESPTVNTEHLLLALLREENTGAAYALNKAGRDLEQIRRLAQEASERNVNPRYKHLYRGQEVILHYETGSALRQAYHAPIGSYHLGTAALLYGLLIAGKNAARDILWAREGDFETLLRVIETASVEQLAPFEERIVPARGVRRRFANITVEHIDYVCVWGQTIREISLLAMFLEAMREAVTTREILQCFYEPVVVKLKGKGTTDGEIIEYTYHHDGRDSLGRPFAEFLRHVREKSKQRQQSDAVPPTCSDKETR